METQENLENEEIDTTTVDLQDETTDEVYYKALYEKEQSEKSKWENRYKSAQKKASTATATVDTESIQKMVNDSVSTVQFYQSNTQANDHRDEIEGYVAKGLDRNEAYQLVLAKKDPSLLLDDAKKAQLAGNTSLNGVPNNHQNTKSIHDMSGEEIDKLSGEEFDKFMDGGSMTRKKFYDDDGK